MWHNSTVSCIYADFMILYRGIFCEEMLLILAVYFGKPATTYCRPIFVLTFVEYYFGYISLKKLYGKQQYRTCINSLQMRVFASLAFISDELACQTNARITDAKVAHMIHTNVGMTSMRSLAKYFRQDEDNDNAIIWFMICGWLA